LPKSHLSTGKRRYGHPALTGVLPEPWLPLKKGQTLANNSRAGQRSNKDANQAVVLTLRKRPSVIRRSKRQSLGTRGGADDLFRDELNGQHPESHKLVDSSVANPWQDARPNLSRPLHTGPMNLSHRLSFDQASGVIVLPEDGTWLEEDDDSESEEEESSDGVQDFQPGQSTAAGAVSTSPVSNSLVLTPSKRRYGTYYHHPERRRPIPGAFPQ
jgi:hypothetical protein